MGVPSTYTDSLANKICEHITLGKSLRYIQEQDGFPTVTTMMRWLGEEDKAYFREQYARARELQADYYADQIVDKAENCRPVTEAIAKARLEIDAIKWVASKLKPKKYGERLTHAGDASAPVAFQNITDIVRELDGRSAGLPEIKG